MLFWYSRGIIIDMLDQALLLEKTTHVLTGTYDFQKLAQQAVDLIVKETGDDVLISAAVFRVHTEHNEMRAYAYSTKKFRKFVDTMLPTKFENLHGPLNLEKNLTVRTYTSNQMQQSTDLVDFTRNVFPDFISHQIQKRLKIGSVLTFPISLKSGKVVGVFMYTSPRTTIPVHELKLFQTFSNQLGLSFQNVFAFERLMHAYKKNMEAQSNTIAENDTPSIKFTLRITPNQLKKLEQLSTNLNKTKAEALRALLDQVVKLSDVA